MTFQPDFVAGQSAGLAKNVCDQKIVLKDPWTVTLFQALCLLFQPLMDLISSFLEINFEIKISSTPTPMNWRTQRIGNWKPP